jgi:hypothetical protein
MISIHRQADLISQETGRKIPVLHSSIPVSGLRKSKIYGVAANTQEDKYK